MTWLLDGNVLVALAINSHVFHERVREWFDALADPFATCAITEGTLLRVHMKLAVDTSASAAWAVLATIHAMPEHRFWNDGFSYQEVKAEIAGSQQVTDAWLAELARRKAGKVATLDTGLVAVHGEVGFLIPA
jgi:toxin-antitoxin system PIN domain toxin